MINLPTSVHKIWVVQSVTITFGYPAISYVNSLAVWKGMDFSIPKRMRQCLIIVLLLAGSKCSPNYLLLPAYIFLYRSIMLFTVCCFFCCCCFFHYMLIFHNKSKQNIGQHSTSQNQVDSLKSTLGDKTFSSKTFGSSKKS